MSAPLRVGFVGVGGMRIAYYHAREFARDARVRLAACCDIVPEALSGFGAAFGIPPDAQYADFETMLQREGLDIAVVCTNETLHAEMTILAASHVSRAVVCEKPMAMCLREADAMLDACRERGLRLIIGHQRRYQELYAAARDRLLAGEIGELREIAASGHPRSHLLADGTHTIDLVRYFAGDPAALWVFGQIDTHTGRHAWGHAVEDAALYRVGFETGVQARLTSGGGFASEKCPLGSALVGNYHHIALHGETGRMDIYGDAPLEGQPQLQIARGAEREVVPIERGWRGGVSPQIHLLECLESGEAHPLNGENARAALEILMAAYESSRIRRIAPLPLENKENPFETILADAP